MTAARRRSGFTLLEVLLASAIGILLLGALYVAFDLVLKQTDAAREAASRGDLMRGVTNLMNNDLANCIGPMPPKSGGGIPEDTSSNSTTPSTTTPSTTTPPTTEAAADPLAALDLTEGVAAADLPFQGGCFGTENQLTLFVSRVPPALANPETANPFSEGMIDTRPDLRRVTYYLSDGGLCRQERPWVTAEGVRNSADADRSTEETDVIAPEVKSVTFSYYGPDGWQSSWTGSDPASDGGSVKGPPRAIKISMVIQLPGTTDQKTVSHVIPLRAATGLYQPPVPEEGTTSTTETTTGTPSP